MHPLFKLNAMTCAGPEGRAVFESFLRSGRPVLLDIFSNVPGSLADNELWAWLASERLLAMPTRYGLRLEAAQAMRPDAESALAKAGLLVFVGEHFPDEFEKRLAEWRARGVGLLWEYAPLAKELPASGSWDGLVVRGIESGGMSRNYSARVLFEHALGRNFNLPIFAQGANTPEAAAVFIALGAAGITLDAETFVLPAPEKLQPGHAQALRAPIEGRLRRSAAQDDWVNVSYALLDAKDSYQLPLGSGLFHGACLPAENPSALMSAFRQQTASVLAGLMDATSDDLASSLGKPAWIQGPMAFLSCSARFAALCGKAGFFPVFSMTALSESEAATLGNSINRENNELGAYGLGFAGPSLFDVAGFVRSLAKHPPAALVLSADQWPRLKEFSALGIPIWLHAQKPIHAKSAHENGVVNWIVEGAESGGHVGYLPGMVLWPLLLKTAAAMESSDIRVIFAGAVTDATSVLFGLLLARACGFRGHVGFQLGTAISAASEAVAAGAAHAAYRNRLMRARQTRVLGPGTGAGLRAVVETSGADEADMLESASAPGFAQKAIGAYREALMGSERGLVFAGEGVLRMQHPFSLAQIIRRLAGFEQAWQEKRRQLRLFDSLDFRVARRLPELDLAVVGAGGLFPGAPDLAAFWENIAENRRSIGEVPPAYWGVANYYEPDLEAACKREARLAYTRTAGRMDYFKFDAVDCLKFRMSPRAAEVADKIQLVLLKALDQAMESAGPLLRFPADRTLVVVANSMGGETSRRVALRTHLADMLACLASAPELECLASSRRASLAARLLEQLGANAPPVTEDSMVGGSPSILAGRLAAFLELRGGCYAVDAACAASLAGLASAAALIRSGQADAAVLGGVDCELSVDAFISFCKLRALSRTVSRPYMADSDGFTMGEGGGILLLKPFELALRDGDKILARITGIGLSSDGIPGALTMPDAQGQELALRRCFEMSGFEPESVQYIEGHGTGTAIGDAIELSVLARVYAAAGAGKIAMGSVKSHIGHLKSAAGMASLIKTVLALNKRALPPAWIEGRQHPVLSAPGCPLKLLPEQRPWRRNGFMPRRAAVSAFGFGGSNAHVHLEEMDETYRLLTGARLLLFSGANRDEVGQRSSRLFSLAQTAGVLDFADPEQMACFGGTGTCRAAMVWNVAKPWQEACSDFASALAGRGDIRDVWFAERSQPRRVAWLFPGQAVAARPPFKQAAATLPFFADAVAAFETHVEARLFEALWPAQAAPVELMFQARRPERQTATVALSLALARVMRMLGFFPNAVAGHSLGFYSALAAAGVLKEPDALRLVQKRADCFAALPPECAGCMVALTADENKARVLASESPVQAHVANMNSPRQTVIALRQTDIDAFMAFLAVRGVEHKLVPVGWAFHSPLVAPAADKFRRHLLEASFHRPHTPIYTERSGERIAADSFDNCFPEWLPSHLADSVRFDRLVQTLAAEGIEVFCEIGAGGTLTRLVKDNLSNAPILAVTLDSTVDDVLAHWQRVWAQLFVHAGCNFDFGAYADFMAGQLRPMRIGAGGAFPRQPPPMRAPDSSGKSERRPQRKSEGKNNDETFLRVRAIIARHTGFDENALCSDQALQESLGVDSLKMMEIGLDIEREFKKPLLLSALPQGITLEGLANRIRSGEAFGGAPSAPQLPRRWIMAQRRLPPASVCAPVGARRPVLLLTHDPALAEAWRNAGLGNAALFELGAGLPGRPKDFLSTHRALVLALRPAPASPGNWSAFESFMGLGHALGRTWLPFVNEKAADLKTPFCVLTAVVGEPGLLGAAWPALTLSLQREYPKILCRHVFCEGRVSTAAALDRLRSELDDPRPDHPVVICRKMTRHAEHLLPVDLPPMQALPAFELRPEDVVLVTGGGRGITATVLRHLAQTQKATWILVGATPPDAPTPQGRARHETALALQEAGSKAHEWTHDLSQEREVRALAERLKAEFPKLAGVIHGAGALADSRLEDKDLSDFLKVLRVKAFSALLLEKALDLSALRFWINFSSLTAYLGNEGQADYSAANAVLASQARRLHKAGVPLAKSVLWSAWRGGGMAAAEALQAALRARGVAIIEPEDGCAFLDLEMRAPAEPVVAFGADPLKTAGVLPMAPDPIWKEQRSIGASTQLITRAFSEADPFLGEHRINGVAVLPGVMALELSARAMPDAPGPRAWENVSFNRLVRLRENSLAFELKRTATDAACAEFDLRETGAVDPAFSGLFRRQAYRRQAVRQPGAGPCAASPGNAELYGATGRLFAGPLFQVLKYGAKVFERLVKARIVPTERAPFAEDCSAVVPIAAFDGMIQMAALWLLEHGHGPCLPAGLAYAWWLGRQTPRQGLAAVVWPVGGPVNGRRFFDGIAMNARESVLVVKGLAMASLPKH